MDSEACGTVRSACLAPSPSEPAPDGVVEIGTSIGRLGRLHMAFACVYNQPVPEENGFYKYVVKKNYRLNGVPDFHGTLKDKDLCQAHALRSARELALLFAKDTPPYGWPVVWKNDHVFAFLPRNNGGYCK